MTDRTKLPDIDITLEQFHSPHYLRHNQRRQEHLASLRLDLAERQVLEIGAGIGDHTTYFLDRGCQVVSLEPRPENCAAFEQLWNKPAYPPSERLTILQGAAGDLENLVQEPFDIIYCYGLLYHLADPAAAMAAMAGRCRELLLLETCVSFGDHEAVNSVQEKQNVPSQAFDGSGCRPTRPWIFNRLKALFPFVYLPRTQPAHEEFPTDWRRPPIGDGLTRAVFIAANGRLDNALLLDQLPDRQERC